MRKKNPFGFIKDGKIFRSAFLDFPERKIGEVRGSEEETFQYFEQRFLLAATKVDALEKSIDEAENKGSYLMKLIHLKDKLIAFDALGDFETLFARLDKQEVYLRHIIAENRVKNLEIKQALLAEAEIYENSVDWKNAGEKLKEIKAKWIKTGNVEDEQQEAVEEKFKQLLDNFYQRRTSFFEDRKRMITDRISKYERLISQAKALLHENDKGAVVGKIKELQTKWKQLEPIPPKKRSQLWKVFQAVTANFFRELKNEKNRQWQNPETGLVRKKELVEKARELAASDGVNSIDEVKRLKHAWRSSGIIPKEMARELSIAFNKACDLAIEKGFLHHIISNKYGELAHKDEKEVIELKIEILNNLLARDEKELNMYLENVEKFNTSGRIDKHLDEKIKLQRRKVSVKKELLEELKNSL